MATTLDKFEVHPTDNGVKFVLGHDTLPFTAVLLFEDGNPLEYSTSKSVPNLEHTFEISNLTAGTSYSYDIIATFGDGTTTGEVGNIVTNTFTTTTAKPIKTFALAVTEAVEKELIVEDPTFFNVFTGRKLTIYADADILVRFEAGEPQITIPAGTIHEFFPAGNLFMIKKAAGTANIELALSQAFK